MIIREMVVDDLYRGYLQCLEPLAETKLLIPEAIQIFQRIKASPNIRIFVAIAEVNWTTTECVGTVTVIAEQKFIHKGGLVGHIEDVSVRKDWHGKRVGKQLVHHALDYCKSLGCYKVILDCREELVSYYNSFGFKKYESGMRLDLACETSERA